MTLCLEAKAQLRKERKKSPLGGFLSIPPHPKRQLEPGLGGLPPSSLLAFPSFDRKLPPDGGRRTEATPPAPAGRPSFILFLSRHSPSGDNSEVCLSLWVFTSLFLSSALYSPCLSLLYLHCSITSPLSSFCMRTAFLLTSLSLLEAGSFGGTHADRQGRHFGQATLLFLRLQGWAGSGHFDIAHACPHTFPSHLCPIDGQAPFICLILLGPGSCLPPPWG